MPLDDLTIVDFSRFLPAAYSSWIAADMGADVIRIEHPRELAKQEAMFGRSADNAASLRARARPTFTRNKRSLLINPGSAAAKPVLHKLISQADVLIEDYRPGVMARMGYGYDDMAAQNPGLIYLSVSLAGQTGPFAGKPGHDPLALALAGALPRLNGLSKPSLPGLQVADPLAGAHASVGLLLALRARDKTGRGQQVDVAMSDASLPLLMVSMARYDNLDDMPPPGTWNPKGGVWECADGKYLCTTDMEPAYWHRFCDAVGKREFIGLQHDRSQHPRIAAELESMFRTRTRDEWFELLAKAETQAMPVLSPEEALDHPHNLARGMILQVPVEGQEPVRQLGLPFTLPGVGFAAPRAAAMPGADNHEILTSLGFDEGELGQAGAFDAETHR
ncbi:MAG: CaiB/BaiF CoA transferase family protein [Sphingomicrobium sp.]